MLDLVIFGAPLVIAFLVLVRFYGVDKHEIGLLFRNGRFRRALQPGLYIRFAPTSRVERVDMRKRITTIPGQDLLTADGISIKISLILEYQVHDAVKSYVAVEDMKTFLYVNAQLATRDVVSARSFEDLMSQRTQLGAELLAGLLPTCEVLGVNATRLDIKDIMLPGDLKKTFSQVALAKQEAAAALERSRGETAVLRNLANAAKMLESNPHLAQLRLLDIMSKESGNTFVVGEGTLKPPNNLPN